MTTDLFRGLLAICWLKSRTLRVVQQNQERRGRSFWSTWKLSGVKLQGRCLGGGTRRTGHDLSSQIRRT